MHFMQEQNGAKRSKKRCQGARRSNSNQGEGNERQQRSRCPSPRVSLPPCFCSLSHHLLTSRRQCRDRPESPSTGLVSVGVPPPEGTAREASRRGDQCRVPGVGSCKPRS